ncbi:hypothetical protein C5167_018604 [Papaver somniferum]|uniref:Uncharacterized protein n=1 Tax=Papaver somniferum TaxID=3469 RepID=A0A4Y7IR31_PAPSO|nr:hypothetical protein C5167_018604 [Papaver somniferum]
MESFAASGQQILISILSRVINTSISFVLNVFGRELPSLDSRVILKWHGSLKTTGRCFAASGQGSLIALFRWSANV